MKAVLISTFDVRGGAARSAFRLMQGLRGLRQPCSMLVREKSSSDPAVHALALENGPEAQQREREIAIARKECIDKRRTPISNTFFSLPEPGYDVSRHEEIRTADVIHLHWVTNLLSPAAIARLHALGKPMVWTLHDQRALTGGCHFTAGCRRFETACADCPQLNLRGLPLVETAFAEASHSLPGGLVIVCPSRWLADCARSSALFRRARIEVIPYGIDTAVFRPGRAAARQHLGWDPAALLFLCGADVAGERRKGFGLLASALRRCLGDASFREAVEAKRIQFLFFGTSTPLADFDLPVQWLGHVSSEEQLARIYAASDAFLLPSIEDNLPNTMLESLCAGTPVIAFDAGGIPEAVESNRNGLVVPAGEGDRFADAILAIAGDPALRGRLADGCGAAADQYALERQASRYSALYTELAAAAKPLASGPALAVQPMAELGPTFASFYPTLLRRARRERLKRRLHALNPFRA